MPSHKEIAQRAKQMYKSSIQQQVDLENNIGKMVIIDIETGNSDFRARDKWKA